MRVQEPATHPHHVSCLGPAPARMVPSVAKAPHQSAESIAPSPRKFAWVAKRFAIWCIGTILSATAFHLTGFLLLGVIAIVFPIGYWAKISIDAQRVFGAEQRNGYRPELGLQTLTYGTPEYFRNRRITQGF